MARSSLTELLSWGYNGLAQKCQMTECWKNYKDKNLASNAISLMAMAMVAAAPPGK